jgi:hypothetical protein
MLDETCGYHWISCGYTCFSSMASGYLQLTLTNSYTTAKTWLVDDYIAVSSILVAGDTIEK